VGNAEELRESLGKFGEISVLDVNGNAVKMDITIPENMTAEKVIEGYLEAIGGREKLSAVKTISSSGSFSVPGQELAYTDIKSEPNKMSMSILMNGMPVMQQVLNGSQGYVIQGPGAPKIPLSEKEVADMQGKSHIFPELYWFDEGHKLELKGAEDLGGKVAYKIILTDASGSQRTCFYDMKSFLKVRTVSESQTRVGPVTSTIDIKSYDEIDAIKTPSEINIKQGPQTIVIKLKTIEINPQLDESTFAQ